MNGPNLSMPSSFLCPLLHCHAKHGNVLLTYFGVLGAFGPILDSISRGDELWEIVFDLFGGGSVCIEWRGRVGKGGYEEIV